MSVLKGKRKESSFEVFHNYYELRRDMTDLLLRDFGFSTDKAEKKILKNFGNKTVDELTEEEENRYIGQVAKISSFDEWFITEERKAIMEYLRNLGMYVFSANAIYPQQQEELTQRRIYQERALGCCMMLKQELQYAIETLPVDVNKYTRFADAIDKEIRLIKAWRKSDNKFKKDFEKSENKTDDK